MFQLDQPAAERIFCSGENQSLKIALQSSDLNPAETVWHATEITMSALEAFLKHGENFNNVYHRFW